MSEGLPPEAFDWSVTAEWWPEGSPLDGAVLTIRSGITALVGPNGSGKTRALRAIQGNAKLNWDQKLPGKKIHFLSAGRISPLEAFRSKSNSPYDYGYQDAAIGNASDFNHWFEYESITGDLLFLESRQDLKIKVESRVQQLLDRRFSFRWTQGGLSIRIASMSGGPDYAANTEASGILQLIALLSAIHNPEIGLLIIDEPEISLHPQHQAFLLEEMEHAAGDPRNAAKKAIVIATHSTNMLKLRQPTDLTRIIFFTSIRRKSVQVDAADTLLNSKRLSNLLVRVGSTHRSAIFAERVLLVEGVSDEIVASELAKRAGLRMLARNAQILPVTGKGEFVETAKLFRLLDKKVTILADLDALADDNKLMSYLSSLPEAQTIADRLGRTSIIDLDRDLRASLDIFMSNFAAEIASMGETYSYWSTNNDQRTFLRRVTLARILSDPRSFAGEAGTTALSICTRYQALLGAALELGCIFIRRGAIENYYNESTVAIDQKPSRALAEAVTFINRDVLDLQGHYEDVFKALNHTAPNQVINENDLLRVKIAAIVTPIFLNMQPNSLPSDLSAIAQNAVGRDAELFHIENTTENGILKIKVGLSSDMFSSDAFPIVFSVDQNPITVLSKAFSLTS